MRLARLLADLTTEQLDLLAIEHFGADPSVVHTSLLTTLEGVLKSFAFVRTFVVNRKPPAFTILEALLDAPGFARPASGFREHVRDRTTELCQLVESREILHRDQQLHLYRRVLVEALRSDLILDASETAILGVLRRELGIRQAEHFLVEHHSDLREFWSNECGFLHEMSVLRSVGLIFAHENQFLIADEVVPALRQVLGLELSKASRRRLYQQLSGNDLADTLQNADLKTSGSKDDKVERLIENYVQPREILSSFGIGGLRDMCRTYGASVSGSKDDLVERLIEHFVDGHDERPTEAPAPTPEPEFKALEEERFKVLFSALRGDELSDILQSVGSSRSTGSKDFKVALLWQSRFAERTLLEVLTNRSIEDVLKHFGLRTSGAKRERVERIIEFLRMPTQQEQSA
jgi:SAP domain-containing protein